MMSRVIVFLFAFLTLFASTQVYAAPAPEIAARQIGGVACNVDRLRIVAGLATLQGTLKKLSSEVTGDATAESEVQSASDSVSGAQSAIGVIAKALLTGQKAPAEARDQVKSNLAAAQETLSGISSTDPTVSQTLEKALSQLASSFSAGEGVVANCK